MLQRRNWKKGVIHREGCEVSITVSPPDDGIDYLTVFTIALIAFGFLWICVPGLLRASSFTDFLWKALPVLVFGVPFFFITRASLEESANEIVTASAATITWARKTIWWTRSRHLDATKIVDIFAETYWTGLADVVVATRWQRYIILSNVLNEDAVRFAAELKRSAK